MRYVLLLLLLGVSLSGWAQGHTNTWGCQNFYKTKAYEDATARPEPCCWPCPPCKAKEDAELAKKKAEDERIQAEILARINKKKADEQAKRDAAAKDLANRRSAALSQLTATEANAREFDRLNQANQERRAAVRRRYQQQEDQANKAYADYLRQLQDAQGATASVAAPEDFWNETVPMSSFEPVEDPKTRLWGYQNKQGKPVLEARYQQALPFHQGVGLVLYRDPKGTYTRQLINTRGEVVRSFDKSYFETVGGGTLTDFAPSSDHGKAFSGGLLVVEFSKKPYDRNTRVGCIDTKGNVAIAPAFYYIKPFRNGTAEAARFEDEERYSFKDEYPGTYEANFTYLQVGLIDRTGKWVAEPQKKMVYNYGLWGENMYLTVESANAPRLSEEEKRAQKARADLEKKKARAVSLAKLEADVQQRVDAAKARGYLTEGAQRN
ncbi:WG repeat-containing protein [Hymenobacter jeollabukensis]|uniref:WG repeat-containing protein n=1 Tax=Hymenobacter jeollabukensis TaxID=2025313 RepID=A0A5R8WJN9_9BACT|nr:WG repeat-containing protein [Hymenobacter jeollabukensis]TLM89167.1 hypothetical protein FDY95_21595 [Hymenobacter jeollabukensis]